METQMLDVARSRRSISARVGMSVWRIIVASRSFGDHTLRPGAGSVNGVDITLTSRWQRWQPTARPTPPRPPPPCRENGPVRIISLLPSATEIVYALGLADQLCGVTFECDFPADARRLPHVSGTALPVDQDLTPAQIDAAVSRLVSSGESIYTLDDALVRRIDPDLILAQDLCRVCAVPSGAVQDALDVLGCTAEVLSLDPHRLDDVIACIGLVGDATGTSARADRLMAELHDRVEAVRRRVAGRPRPSVLVLEWADPPFNAGHWVPDMVDAAGGLAVLADPGARSQRLTWDQIGAAAVDTVVFMPCGFDLAGAVEQAEPLLARAELRYAAAFWAVDANALFSRPGPRIVDGVEVLADLLHGNGLDGPGAARLR
jgi:iron complex transport system substrate-binding protein